MDPERSSSLANLDAQSHAPLAHVVAFAPHTGRRVRPQKFSTTGAPVLLVGLESEYALVKLTWRSVTESFGDLKSPSVERGPVLPGAFHENPPGRLRYAALVAMDHIDQEIHSRRAHGEALVIDTRESAGIVRTA